jgi:multidrug efflux pump subunit AcrB
LETKNTTPATVLSGAGGFDLQRFGMEVANEIGVDPNNLAAYGLTPQRIEAYEAQTHSDRQGGAQ